MASVLRHVLLVATWLICVSVHPAAVQTPDHSDNVPREMVAMWATNFGNMVAQVCRQNTSRDAILKEYEKSASVVRVDAMELLNPMVEQIVQMMGSKREAVQRIVDSAEAASLSHKFDSSLQVNYLNAKRLNSGREDSNDAPSDYNDDVSDYDSATDADGDGYRWLQMRNSSDQFGHIPINTTFSTVHVPTNVYDKAPDVMNAIFWSQKLDRVFATNYRNDPTLSWQYFGSSTGFMRQYPGMKWLVDDNEPDLYDCRVREWYIRAASSPKDVVILLDLSGSMTGLRMEIAKHVVMHILDTLNANDYVNVLSFSQYTEPVYPCFGQSLVQANLENLRVFKEALDDIETKELANFTSALTAAFEMLKTTRQTGRGAMCNQAIMLVTDGAPYHYEHVFNKYNRPDKQVRIFTYLIGRDVSDSEAVQWMACENKGYYTKVTTLAEVGEQVQKYVPVLARPWVLYRTQHPAVWTGVYADVANPKLTDWLWETRERQRQYQRSRNYQRMELFSSGPQDHQYDNVSGKCYNQVQTYLTYGKEFLTDEERHQIEAERYLESRLDLRESEHVDKWTLLIPQPLAAAKHALPERRSHQRHLSGVGETHTVKVAALTRGKVSDRRLVTELSYHQGRTNSETTRRGYRLMTSIAMPVFDKHKIRNVTEKIYTNTTRWVYRTREKRVAMLLGVAGTDVPISEIQKLAPPHQLGVNGYSFIIDNNGYMLYHPDLRPVHRISTKQFQEILKPNYNTVDITEVEIPDFDEPSFNYSKLDSLRMNMIDRGKAETAFVVRQHYDNMRRVVVRLQRYSYAPIDGSPFSLAIVLPDRYGDKRVQGQVEVSQAVKSREPIPRYFEGPNWSVHPNWVYCEYDSHVDLHDAHSLNTPRQLFVHFLRKAMSTPNFEWRSLRLYPTPQLKRRGYTAASGSYGTYFCDRDLFQSVIFDARATMPFVQGKPIGGSNIGTFKPSCLVKHFISDNVSQDHVLGRISEGLFQTFGAVHSFVATRSGFTRWRSHWPSVAEAPQQKEEHLRFRSFRATDETWYRRAVDFAEIDATAFVFSVPFDASLRNDSLVTASQAVSLQTDGRRAPAAVVGMHFLLSRFRDKLLSSTNCPSVVDDCTRTCASDELDCLVLDDSGYVLVSERHSDTGRFVGELHGSVLHALLRHGVYSRRRMFDYQAVCLDAKTTVTAAGWTLNTPLVYIGRMFGWLAHMGLWLLLQSNLISLAGANVAWAAQRAVYDYDSGDAGGEYHIVDNDDHRRSSDGADRTPPQYVDYAVTNDDNDKPSDKDGRTEDGFQCPPDQLVENDQVFRMAHINKTRPRPCHQYADLLVFNPDTQRVQGELDYCDNGGGHARACSRKFVLERLPYTNLMLLVINSLCPCDDQPVSSRPTEWLYPPQPVPPTTAPSGVAAGNDSSASRPLVCRHHSEELYRRRPLGCQKYHAEEESIDMCGRDSGAANMCVSWWLATSCMMAAIWLSQRGPPRTWALCIG